MFVNSSFTTCRRFFQILFSIPCYYHMAERKLKPYFKDGKLPITVWRKERDRLEQEYKTEQAELSPIHAEVKKLWQIKYKVEQVIHAQEKTAQSRTKKHQIEH